MELTGKELMAIRQNEWRGIFGQDPVKGKQIWRKLASKWHPDHNKDPESGHVIGHIRQLYESAQCRWGKGSAPKEKRIRHRDGKEYRLRYLREHEVEVGHAYVGRTIAAYILKPGYEDLGRAAFSIVKDLPYHDNEMREAMRHVLPGTVQHLELEQGSALVFEKETGFVPLKDLRAIADQGLEPKHVAWMTSSMLNLVCYLETMKLAHQGMNLENLLVDPAHHSVALYGGWWWAGRQDEPLHALSSRISRIAPRDMLMKKQCDVRLDQFTVRETARELLGEHWKSISPSMKEFLELPPTGTAVDDYRNWMEVLKETFGGRRFVKLGITAEDVYKLDN